MRCRGFCVRMQGTHRLLAELLYCTGLRIMEALRLRVKDVDFGRAEILVRDGKGAKDRVTMLPRRLFAPLRRQIAVSVRRTTHQRTKADSSRRPPGSGPRLPDVR